MTQPLSAYLLGALAMLCPSECLLSGQRERAFTPYRLPQNKASDKAALCSLRWPEVRELEASCRLHSCSWRASPYFKRNPSGPSPHLLPLSASLTSSHDPCLFPPLPPASTSYPSTIVTICRSSKPPVLHLFYSHCCLLTLECHPSLSHPPNTLQHSRSYLFRKILLTSCQFILCTP